VEIIWELMFWPASSTVPMIREYPPQGCATQEGRSIALAVLDRDLTVENEPGEVVGGNLTMGLLGLRCIDLGQPDLLAPTLNVDHDGIPVDHARDGAGELRCPATPADE
jgi:hypothetical protein